MRHFKPQRISVSIAGYQYNSASTLVKKFSLLQAAPSSTGSWYRISVEGRTSDLVNWEGPWMPRGPHLGVLPSLHGVMYKHWIIKLHLSISPPPTRGRLCQPLSRHLLYLQSANPPLKSGHFLLFLDFLCFVSVYCLPLSAIFPAVIAPKEWEAGNSKRR